MDSSVSSSDSDDEGIGDKDKKKKKLKKKKEKKVGVWRKVRGHHLQNPVKQERTENNLSLFNKEIHWGRAHRAEPYCLP